MAPELTFIRRETRFKLFTVFAILAIVFTVLLKVDNMLVSFLLAFVITYLLNPLVNHLERSGLSRSTAIVIPFMIIGIILGLAVYILSPIVVSQFKSMGEEFPKYLSGVTDLFARTETQAKTFLGPLFQHSTGEKIVSYMEGMAQSIIQGLPAMASQLLTTMILAPFFAFFMLRDGRLLSRQLLSIVPNNFFELALNLVHQINQQMGGFIRARLLESAIVGFVVWAGLALIGFPYSVFLAVFAGITNLIPYVGPVIGAVPAFFISFVNKDPSMTVLLMSSVYFVAQLIDTVVIIPLVIAKIVNLHPVTVVIVIIIGSQLMGILGMIISIPVASAIKVTTTAVYNHIIGFRI
jgi:putative permease